MTPDTVAPLARDADKMDDFTKAAQALERGLCAQPIPLPASIRIGFQTFTVKEIRGGEKERSNYQGYSSFGRAYMAVARKPNTVDEANTLLHEVLHMCWSAMDIQDGDPEERTITKLTNSLCQIWRDNPDLLAYLNASLRPPGK